MTNHSAERDFWTSLCADVRTAGGMMLQEPPTTTTATVGGDFVIKANVPGFDSPELTINWDDGSVRILGQALPTPGHVAGVGGPRDFVLRCPVPPGFDTSQLRAELSLGVLVVTIPPKVKPAPVHPAAPAVTDRR